MVVRKCQRRKEHHDSRSGLNFAGTRKWRRTPAPEELLTQPKLLSDWAVQAGLLDRGIEVAEDDLEAAIALREAIYRTVTARLEGRRPKSADVELLNEHGSHAQLTPRLDRTGAVRREGTPSQLLARLAADLLDLLAGPDIEKVKGCAHPGCSRLYVDSSRAQNRHWCGKVADPGDADGHGVSPGCMNSCGVRSIPVPPHVPLLIRSPGCNVTVWVTNSRSVGRVTGAPAMTAFLWLQLGSPCASPRTIVTNGCGGHLA
jgi:predicted RNA-binding Zn ribbon-like protein